MIDLFPSYPKNETELLKRAQQLAGQNFITLAEQFNLFIPINLKRHKGWVGNLIELHLGAKNKNKAKQDFPHFGIELKTIPVDLQGNPLETTFVCIAPLIRNNGVTWETSYVKRKLTRVLWIPVEGSHFVPLPQRRVGSPILWTPTSKDLLILRQDWEELMDMIVLGQVNNITAHHGEYLQIRPKAANSKILTTGINKYGQSIMVLPRAFYLKKNFTRKLLKRFFS
ncbi:DNA mismatch repair endonuclease MutH [Pantoea sp. Aalb]|uniref:DNA mismatch repair endonuclease MutH n=1 Tax=Pantoea sp. Aalb TaxID=2576762 RepID=UPI00132B7B97|nr:DNA mismatch repair endonuclease MutH [Pantoea sp. Aalb]MXP67742.1 DNA mismatch repair endonuclease MutH [Pantoea sp. Aalb]